MDLLTWNTTGCMMHEATTLETIATHLYNIMPLGIITEEEFQKELASAPAPLISFVRRGRNEAKETPDSIRKIAASLAIEGVPAKEIEKEFGLSPSSISAYKNGSHSTSNYNEGNQELRKFVNDKKDEIVRTAHSKISEVLLAITPEKISESSARDNSSIAKDLSVVIKNITPEQEHKPDVSFVIHVPVQKSERDYGDVIDISANED